MEYPLFKLKPWEEFTPLFRITGADFSGSKFSYTAQDCPTNKRLQAWAVPPKIDELEPPYRKSLDDAVQEAERSKRQVIGRYSATFVGSIDDELYFVARDSGDRLTEFHLPKTDFLPRAIYEGMRFTYLELAVDGSEERDFCFLIPDEHRRIYLT